MALSVTLLALMQAIMISSNIALFASSPLIGLKLAHDPSWASVPLSLQYLCVLLTLYPVSLWMQKYGRRSVFIGANIFGIIGMVVGFIGIHTGQFYVYVLSGPFIGIFVASAQFYRFAAADAAPPDRKARAVSLTLAGGLIAAFLGANLVRYTIHITEPEFSATYLSLAILIFLSLLLATRLDLPSMAVAQQDGDEKPRPLGVIIRQKSFIAAALAAMVGYGVMNLTMISAPFAIAHEHYEFSLVTTVLQWHSFAMFLPSFFTGDLIKRFGVTKIIWCGALVMASAVAVAFAGLAPEHFIFSMVLIGLGWNFLYIGGTTLLTESYRPIEKARIQGLNDTLVFATIFSTSLISAQLMHSFGWHGVVASALPFLLVVVVAVAIYAFTRPTAPVKA